MFNIISNIIFNINKIVCYVIAALIGWLFELVENVGISVDRVVASFPGLNTTVYDTVAVVGYTLALLFFAFGLMQFVFPNTEIDLPSENPVTAVFRFVVAVIFVAYFKTFFLDIFVNKLFIPIFNELNTNFAKVSEPEYWFSTLIGSLESYNTSTLSQIVNLIIIILFGITLLINSVKFVIYHFERLFELTFLIYVSPLACSTYTHKALSPIFKNYIKLIVEQALCIIFNLIIVKLMINGINSADTISMLAKGSKDALVAATNPSLAENVASYFVDTTRNYVVQMLLLTAILSVGKKMSVKIGQVLGINGMSDVVRPGLGMLGAVGGFAAHSIMHSGHGGGNGGSGDVKPSNTSAVADEKSNKFASAVEKFVYATTGSATTAAVAGKAAYKASQPLTKAQAKMQNTANDIKNRASEIAQEQDANAADTDSVNANPNQDKENQNGTDTQNAQNPNMDKNAEGKETNQVPNGDKNADGKETNQVPNGNQNGEKPNTQQNPNGKETEKANANSINKNENSPTANTTNNGMNKNDIANQENSNANNNNSEQNGGNAANTENVSNMNAQNKNENSNNNSANATNTNKVDQAIKNGGNTATQNISNSAEGGSNASGGSTKVVSGATSKQTSGPSGENSRPSAPSGNNRPGSKNNYVQSTQQGSVSHNNTQNVSHGGNSYNSTPSSSTPNSGTSGAGNTGAPYSPQSSNPSMPQSSGSENSGQSFKKVDFD